MPKRRATNFFSARDVMLVGMKAILVIFLLLGLLGFIAVVVINIWVCSYSSSGIFADVESFSDEDRVAIVLGARVEDDGTPSNTLYDRMLTGVELYKAGKTRKLLLSGGGGEPKVMKRLALEFGVPEQDLIIDELGTRTYESCVRAKNIFGVTQAVIVTQDYHLPRSIYLCENVGIDAIGFDAKRRDYLGERYAWLREYFSRVKAWGDINFR